MIKDCYVGVKGIIRVSGKCLVLKKSTGDLAYWDVPGGRIEDDESLEKTLTRELTEELPSLKEYTIGKVVHSSRLGFDMDNGKALVFVFFIVDAKPFEIELTSEHEGFIWVTKETLPELLRGDYAIEPKYYEAISAALQ